MILRVPPCLAVVRVVAESAVRHGIRREVASHAGVAREAAADRTVVRREVPTSEPLELAGAEEHVHPLGLMSLDGRNLLAVERELQDVRRLRMARELRVPHLVAPAAERGR